MTRSFHHRTTLGAVCGIVLFLLLAVYAFWIKKVILGLLMAFHLLSSQREPCIANMSFPMESSL